MNTLIKTKLFQAGLFLLFLGFISYIMENIFYGYIDRNGVLRESFFLPLAFIGFLLGIMSLLVSVMRYYLKRRKMR